MIYLVLGPRFNLTIRIFVASHIQFASHCDVHVMLIFITPEAVHVLIGVATLGARGGHRIQVKTPRSQTGIT